MSYFYIFMICLDRLITLHWLIFKLKKFLFYCLFIYFGNRGELLIIKRIFLLKGILRILRRFIELSWILEWNSLLLFILRRLIRMILIKGLVRRLRRSIKLLISSLLVIVLIRLMIFWRRGLEMWTIIKIGSWLHRL